uniref:Uncharacterized protein n=1 Tax=Knipowitschia caucasica TaxID=637954 RepID=A0AAV2LVJ6_KNICA
MEFSVICNREFSEASQRLEPVTHAPDLFIGLLNGSPWKLAVWWGTIEDKLHGFTGVFPPQVLGQLEHHSDAPWQTECMSDLSLALVLGAPQLARMDPWDTRQRRVKFLQEAGETRTRRPLQQQTFGFLPHLQVGTKVSQSQVLGEASLCLQEFGTQRTGETSLIPFHLSPDPAFARMTRHGARFKG